MCFRRKASHLDARTLNTWAIDDTTIKPRPTNSTLIKRLNGTFVLSSNEYELIRRGIDPRFSIRIVEEIWRRCGVAYTVINDSKSSLTEKRSYDVLQEKQVKAEEIRNKHASTVHNRLLQWIYLSIPYSTKGLFRVPLSELQRGVIASFSLLSFLEVVVGQSSRILCSYILLGNTNKNRWDIFPFVLSSLASSLPAQSFWKCWWNHFSFHT